MEALVWHGRGDLRLEEVDEPRDPGPDEAILEVSYCGICGTDIHEYLEGPVLIRPGGHPLTGEAPPLALGHEISGRIVALGSECDGLAVGARVAVDPCWRCGRCYWCLRGDYHLCRIGGGVGLASAGGLAQYVRVPVAGLVALPDTVDDRTAALAEPLAVGFHAVERARLQSGDVVVVQGAGPIGAAVLLAALTAGAGAVLVADPVPERRSAAAALGAAGTFDPSACDLRAEVLGATGRIGADVVVDCTGRPDVLPLSVNLTRRGGRVVVAGVGHGAAPIEINRLVLSERELIGTVAYRHDVARVVRLIAAGRFDPRPLITSVVPLSRAREDAFDVLCRPNGELKILVEVNGGANSVKE